MELQVCIGVETSTQLFAPYDETLQLLRPEYPAPCELEMVPLHQAWYESAFRSVAHWVNIQIGVGSFGIA